jgi:serine phosphatase RsbU (regulator of sigma subunit)
LPGVHLDHRPGGDPLGVGEGEFQPADVIIPLGATLVLYTDGLVETRHRDIDAGITALRTALAGHHSGLEATADTVLDTLNDQRGGDDIALLLVRPT